MENNHPSKLKNHLTLVLKILLVGGLLYFLGKKGFISIHDTKRAFTRLDNIIPAVMTLFGVTALSILRWQWLLRTQNIHLPFLRVFELALVGLFFNIALPGAVSGDFVKAFYIGKEIKGERARAFGSIFFDRLAGLSALVLVSAIAMFVGLGFAWGSKLMKHIQVFIFLAAATVILFYAYLFFIGEHADPLLKVLRQLSSRFQRIGSLYRIYESIRHYRNHRWTVLKVLLLSVLVHLLVGWACLNFARALGEDQLALLAMYIVVPLGLLVTAIPVLPAGVGTGHAAFLYFFGLIGSQRGADVFTLFALVNIAVGALGGLVYLRFRSHGQKVSLETVAD